ncbi:hypothetical protein K435DRAFT_858548 [Dendrothele bispora CBS 962.96]|uniref:F-box domain-containing protein n=1 Tax=Dendrothele bispora (strain CBS 962.96) TaxID=1314807 RepID=A0A4S8M2T3_DENBC|nr:hypothetical protein K435DRAFT_858548 [Dendrothele bispora CBS 962.96]
MRTPARMSARRQSPCSSSLTLNRCQSPDPSYSPRRSPRKPSPRHRYANGWIRSPAQSRKTKRRNSKAKARASPLHQRMKIPAVKSASLPTEIFFEIAQFVSANENSPLNSQKALSVASQVCRNWRGPFQHELFHVRPTCLSTDTFNTGRAFTRLVSSGHFAHLVTVLNIQMHHLTWLDALDDWHQFTNLTSITLEGKGSQRQFTCLASLFKKNTKLSVITFVNLVITIAELTRFFRSLEADIKTSSVRKLTFNSCELVREYFRNPCQVLPLSFVNLLLVLKNTRNPEALLTDYRLNGLSRLSVEGPYVSLPVLLEFLNAYGSGLTHLSILRFYDWMIEIAPEDFACRFIQQLRSLNLELLEHLSIQYTWKANKVSDILLQKLLTEPFPNLTTLFVSTHFSNDGCLDRILSDIAGQRPQLLLHANSRFENWYHDAQKTLAQLIQNFHPRLQLGQGGEDCSDDELMAQGIPWY